MLGKNINCMGKKEKKLRFSTGFSSRRAAPKNQQLTEQHIPSFSIQEGRKSHISLFHLAHITNAFLAQGLPQRVQST